MVSEFEKKYTELNTEQRKAVDAIEGPVMVVAGPGTGKTQILTLRIAHILLKTDINPENILAITFTEAGAAAMRSRLIQIIGSSAYQVHISTFHGFCNFLIKEYPDEFSHIIGAQNSTEIEVAQIIEDILSRGVYKELRPFGDAFFYVKHIMRSIADMKREGIDPDEFSQIVSLERKQFSEIKDLFHQKGPHAGKMKGEYQIREKQIRKQEELSRLYIEYRNIQRERKIYDFEDMILEVLAVCKRDKDFLQIIQERFLYVLVDEHQDTNNGQNRILELLMSYHPDPNIFIVGDEKQAIFRFQGASLENFVYFKKKYPSAQLIVLENNYRSSQTILDVAHTIIPGRARLLACAGHDNIEIQVGVANTQDDELSWLAEDIKKKINCGVAPGEIAVLYRDNKDAEQIVDVLERNKISVRVYTEGNALRDRDIQNLLLLLKSVHQIGDGESLARVLHIDFLHFNPIDIYKCMSGASQLSLIDRMRNRDFLIHVGIQDVNHFLDFGKQLSTWKTVSMNKRLSESFEIVMRESGFLDHIMSGSHATQKLSALDSLFNEVKNGEEKHNSFSLGDFLSYIDTVESHNIRVKMGQSHPVSHEIHCMTAHKSKGLEFSYVYIVHVHDGHWGNRKTKNILKLPDAIYMQSDMSSEDSDDERRLFYVALTRAKKGVIISYATHDVHGREILPSQFIKEIHRDHVSTFQIDTFKAPILIPKQSSREVLKDVALVTHLLGERGISATALNNYLDCPWRYFYLNLLRIPSAMTKFQIYGNVIHSTLEDFFSKFSSKDPGVEFLLDRFLFHVAETHLKTEEREEVIEKGKRALSGYYNTYHAFWPHTVQTEKSFRGVFLTPEIRLTGKIDKIEILNTNGDVNVVDYKTEKPKTRNDIEGKTKSSRGNTKRQLVFYKLLLDLYNGPEHFHFTSGQIDFIEPDEKGLYHSEQFIISEHEGEELKEEIKRAVHEIQTLAFWDRRCDDAACKYCALRELL